MEGKPVSDDCQIYRGLPGIIAVDLQGSIFIDSFFIQPIEFFQRQQGEWQLDRGGRIKIESGISVEIIIPE